MTSLLESARLDARTRFAPRSYPLVWLAAPALLGLARLLPADGAGLALRLAAATACLLLPGALVARALGLGGVSPAFVWSLGALFAALAVTFAVHGSLWLTLALFGGIGLVAAPFAVGRPSARLSPWSLGALALGAAVGISLWWVAGFDGDAFFHLGRVQKLLALDSLSLRSMDEFRDGGLHPGYAFPLWHAAVALIARLAGVGATPAVLHLPTVLVPLSFVLTYEAGATLFRSGWAGLATALGQFALLGFAPGHGGSLVSLGLAANASRGLVLPALLALFFAYIRAPTWPLLASVAGASGAMTLIHPPHIALVAVGLAGFAVARMLLVRRDLFRLGAALVAVLIPAGGVVLWLLPIVRTTASHNPGAGEIRRAFVSYRNELDIFSLHSYRLRPELFGRAGAIAAAVLVLLPLAALARRRLWAAYVLGAMLATFAVALPSFVFPHFADALSISQARRLIAFTPRAFALAGIALVLARALRVWVLPVALAAGIVLQIFFPGDFGRPYHHAHGTPAWLTWFAFAATAAALVVAALAGRRLPQLERDGPVAAAAVALFVLPVAVYGYSHWTTFAGARPPLAGATVRALREHLPTGAVVFSDPQTAYELAGALPVYVNSTPPTHSSDTKANHPAGRMRDAQRFFRDGGPLSVPRRYGAGWVLVDRTRVLHKRFPLPRVYADGRYVLYRVR